MSNVSKIVAVIVVVAVVAGGAVWLATSKKDDKKTPHTTSSATNDATVAAIITYNGSGFSTSTASIKAGSTVKVVNDSQSQLNFDSDPHPVHTDEPELNAGDVEPGHSKTFTVTKPGTWGFHNHLNPSQHGTLTVQ